MSSTVLILGAGPNIGTSIAQLFKTKGFRVAAASRTIPPSLSSSTDLTLLADFADPACVPGIFADVRKALGIPSVVIYNAASIGSTNLGGPASDLTDSLAVNAVSLYAALQEAVAGFGELQKETKKTFIYTGNKLNLAPTPFLAMLGIGKAAGASLVQVADMNYSAEGYKFHYADERKENGDVIGMARGGDSHAKFYWKLANHEKNGDEEIPWLATFVDRKGYVDFGGK